MPPMPQQYAPIKSRDSTDIDTFCSDDEPASPSMPAGSVRSKKSYRSKKSTRSRRRVDNDELSVPLHTSGPDGSFESGTGAGDDQQFDDDDLEAGGHTIKGASVSLDDDPFYVFREDLTRKLSLMDDALERYLGVIHDTDSAANVGAVKYAKKHLKRQIKNAESTLNDLQTTVTLVESKRDKFLHIDDSELYDRRSFVQTSHDRISNARRDMSSESVRSKIMSDERALAARRAGTLGAQTEEEKENTNFVVDTQAQAQMMLNQQDEALDDLDEAVVRVGHMASEIHDELGQQNKMLTELEDDLADAEEKLGLVMGKLAKLLKTKNKCQLGTILILVMIVLILFFLVIYT